MIRPTSSGRTRPGTGGSMPAGAPPYDGGPNRPGDPHSLRSPGPSGDHDTPDVEQLRRSLERERHETEQLRALDRAKTTFLHAISHELRTPLAAVLRAARTLERGYGLLPGEEALAPLARLSSNARKLDRILSDLLDLGRLSPGTVEVRQVPCELAGLLRRTVEECDGLQDRQVYLDTPVTWGLADPPKGGRIAENPPPNAAPFP